MNTSNFFKIYIWVLWAVKVGGGSFSCAFLELLFNTWYLCYGSCAQIYLAPHAFNIYMKLLRDVIQGCGAKYHQDADNTHIYLSSRIRVRQRKCWPGQRLELAMSWVTKGCTTVAKLSLFRNVHIWHTSQSLETALPSVSDAAKSPPKLQRPNQGYAVLYTLSSWTVRRVAHQHHPHSMSQQHMQVLPGPSPRQRCFQVSKIVIPWTTIPCPVSPAHVDAARSTLRSKSRSDLLCPACLFLEQGKINDSIN